MHTKVIVFFYLYYCFGRNNHFTVSLGDLITNVRCFSVTRSQHGVRGVQKEPFKFNVPNRLLTCTYVTMTHL